MPYCPSCGDKYHAPKNFCDKCGQQLASTNLSTHQMHDDYLAASFETALDRTSERRRRRRETVNESNDSLQMYLGAVGVIAMIHGLSLMMGSGTILKVLEGPFGWLMLAGLFFGALFKVIFDVRLGYSVTRSLIETVVIGAVAYVLVVGVFWYINENLIKSGQPLFNFPILPTPTPAS